MEWSKIGDFLLDNGLPLLGGIVGGPAGAGVGKLIASALGSGDKPDDVLTAIQADPAALEKLKTLEANNRQELEKLYLQSETANLAEVNQTMRTEVASNDGFVRRARPMIIYIVAYALFMQINLALYVAVANPTQIGQLDGVFSALATPLSIALAVVGVFIKKRSDEKMAGIPKGPTLAQSILGALGKG